MLEREIVFQGPDTVAAFIAEPIQGAGGVIVPPPNYWPLVREVCDRHGVLLIADEVVTGFGRTGALFGTRLWGVKADLWCLAKGISSGYVPLGATAISQQVAEVFDADTSGAARCRTATPTAPTRWPQRRRWPRWRRSRRWTSRPMWRASASGCSSGCRTSSSATSWAMCAAIGLMAGIEMVADKSRRSTLPKGSDCRSASTGRPTGAASWCASPAPT
jgi:putrescine aminotransferase